jgi:hypothetical protein
LSPNEVVRFAGEIPSGRGNVFLSAGGLLYSPNLYADFRTSQSEKANRSRMRSIEMKAVVRLVLVILVLSSLALHANAQVSSANITGHVIDKNRGLPTADAKLVKEQTEATVTPRAGETGKFTFINGQSTRVQISGGL